MDSTQRKTFTSFFNTYNTLDVDANIALRTPDCRHTIAPASASIHRVMDNEGLTKHMSGLKTYLIGIPITIKETFEAKGSNTVTVWATSKGQFREEIKDDDPTVDWSYDGEYIFVLTFNEAGDKIKGVLEFLDNKKLAAIMSLAGRADKNLAANKKGSL